MGKKRSVVHIGFCCVLVIFLSANSFTSFAGERDAFTHHYSIFNADGNYKYENPLTGSYMAAVNNMAGQLESDTGRPHISKGKFLGEVLSGMAGNFVFGAVGGYIGLSVSSKSDDWHEDYWYFTAATAFAAGYLVGSTFGSAVGVYLAGKSRDTTGSFGKALLGSIIGGAIAYGLTALTNSDAVGWAAFITMPPVCAAVLFNSSLRYKTSPGSGNALLNFRGGKMKIGIPLVQVQPYPLYVKNTKRTIRLNINLMSVSF